MTSTQERHAATRTQSRAAEFRQALTEKILVADGAMATALFAKGVLPSRCLEELNLSLAALVRDVHRDAMRAGAQILESNTFGANRIRLGAFGYADRVKRINQAGVKIAREAAAGEAFVAGAVGPLGVALEPYGPLSPEEVRQIFLEQIGALVAAGADLLILETFQDLRELREAAAAAREAAGEEMVIVAQISVNEDIRLPDGTTAEAAAREMDWMPVDVIGVNCGTGPRSVLAALEAMSGATSKPLSAMPSAGMPSGLDFPCSPGYLATYARRFGDAGARIVGGCCGTTPDHVFEVKGAVGDMVPVPRPPAPAAEAAAVADQEPAALSGRSRLGSNLASREFIVIAEVNPNWNGPVSAIDALAVSDVNTSRIPVLSAAQAAQKRTSVECILTSSFQGQSAVAIRGQLQAAHSTGVHNIIATGTNASVVAHVAGRLNRGWDLGANTSASQTSLVVGLEVPLSPASEDELRRLESAVEHGVAFLVTAPVFDVDELQSLLHRLAPLQLPVIATLRPLLDERDAEYVANELGLRVPSAIAARASEGVAVALELAEQIQPMVAGIRLVGDFDAAFAVAQAIGARR